MFGPSDEFECQGQRLKVKVTRDQKNRKTAESSPYNELYAAKYGQQTEPYCGRRGCTVMGTFGGLRAVHVW